MNAIAYVEEDGQKPGSDLKFKCSNSSTAISDEFLKYASTT